MEQRQLTSLPSIATFGYLLQNLIAKQHHKWSWKKSGYHGRDHPQVCMGICAPIAIAIQEPASNFALSLTVFYFYNQKL